MALASLLLAGMIAVPTMAADPEITAVISIATGTGSAPTAQVEVTWDDAWFAGDSSVYQHKLALAAMALSGAAYADNGAGVGDALEKLGFGNIKSYNYQSAADSGSDTAAYTFATKTVADKKGNPTQLVAIIVRGTNGAAEWTSNLNMGTGRDHEGFSRAAVELLTNLTVYLPGAGVTADTPVKFLVTGHSRGGAVANLAAAKLQNSQLAAGGNVYGYTFAAPCVSVNAVRKGYENIFNIVNDEDLVTQVPLKDWGYFRYGVDLSLPHGGSEGYDALFPEMNQMFSELTGQNYAVYQNPGAVQQMTRIIRMIAPTVSSGNMAMLDAALRGDWDGLSTLMKENRLAAALAGGGALLLLRQLQQETAGIVSAHCMAGYYSWLTVWEPAEDAF